MAKFTASKGNRIKKGTWKNGTRRRYMFFGLEPDVLENLENGMQGLIWCDVANKWMTKIEFNNNPEWKSASCMNSRIRSLKAAEAHLRRHDEIPKGTKFQFVSAFAEHDIYLVKK